MSVISGNKEEVEDLRKKGQTTWAIIAEKKAKRNDRTWGQQL